VQLKLDRINWKPGLARPRVTTWWASARTGVRVWVAAAGRRHWAGAGSLWLATLALAPHPSPMTASSKTLLREIRKDHIYHRNEREK
jgi:hypothetical protein